MTIFFYSWRAKIPGLFGTRASEHVASYEIFIF